MPCRQASTFNGVTGSGQAGGGGFATESDCLQACKEGACCEGTTCSVKPQCQCKCTTGRCCGPDTIQVRPGEFYSAYRVESREACIARGGSWKCGSFGPQSIEGYTGAPVCPTNAGTPEPVFKGVGTTCAGNPCGGCCCVNGIADTTKNEQQCIAAGGTWKGYACNSPTPSSVLLTLSLTNFTTVFPTGSSYGSGTWDFDFSCIKTSYTLQRGVPTAQHYGCITPELRAAVIFSTNGPRTNNPVNNTVCSCITPLFIYGDLFSQTQTVAIRRGSAVTSVNCNPEGSIGLSNSFPFYFVANGMNGPLPSMFSTLEVPTFCSGQWSISGTVYGMNDTPCGTFTLGNPLP